MAAKPANPIGLDVVVEDDDALGLASVLLKENEGAVDAVDSVTFLFCRSLTRIRALSFPWLIAASNADEAVVATLLD